ncbi:MAG: UDP-glucose/GDP-mannose dehydrogenase family protein, partial [Pseudomonadota bacterium]|nr:UDP-glucose/GDP-mannose dehydrogenase family protein [Pseudomonadota bacterium]
MQSLPSTATLAHGPELKAYHITVVGTGAVGLVTAAGLASFGHVVTALDVDEARIERLCRNQIPIHEAGLDALVRAQATAGRLAFTSDTARALAGADLVFIAVGTPSREDGSVDMTAMDEVGRRIAELVRGPTVVVIKSTVPVGTAQRLQAELREAAESDDAVAQVMSNPEFLREGSAVSDFLRPDRMIVGYDGPPGPARARLLSVFASLVAHGMPVIEMDTRSAELAKCAANAMLAARISFMNEMAAIASATGADIERVREGVGSDPRIGAQFLRAGLGYGGSCLSKDVAALRETARRHNLRSDMLLATERVNSRQRCWAFDALRRDLGSRDALRGLKVAIWGLAFKPGTDDMREAPSLALVDRLWRAGAELRLFDPAAMDNARRLIGASRRVVWAGSAADALRDAEVLMLVTEWPELVDFDLRHLKETPHLRTVYDGRNALDARAWSE